MKKLPMATLTGLAAFASIAPAVAMAATTTTSYVETNHGWVDYHSAARLSSPITGRLLLGDKAPLVKKANAWWYEISVNGKDVYITTNSNYTHVVTETSAPSSNTSSGSTASSTTSSSNSPSTTSTLTYVETNHGWVDYHSAAALSSPITGRLLLGDKAPLVSKANAWWYEISVNGKDVYITTNSNYTHLVTGGAPSAASSGATSSSGSASSTSTGTSPTSTAPTSSSSAGSTASSEPAWQVQADKVIATAKTQLGVPYLWGHQDPGVGFDCSNFTAWSYKTALGISFSGASQVQRDSVGTPVALSDIREGDLLFFKTKNNATGSGHVGIYMGNGQVIQEGGGWGKVTIEPLKGTWLGSNLVYARRVIK